MPKDLTLLPYGAYLAPDGSSVFFDRDYRPIVRVHEPVACDPAERIEHSNKIWFYTDATSPRRDKKTRAQLNALVESIPALGVEIKRRAAART
jgi:hypothetical protein